MTAGEGGPRRPLFILNPAAGGGRSQRLLPLVEEAVAQHNNAAEILLTQRVGHAQQLASHAAEDGFDAVIGVGGDGTLHEIANGLLAGGPVVPIGAIAAGSGNDFVRSLGLPSDPRQALEQVWSAEPRWMDMAQCRERFFVNAGGVGFDARVARAAQQMPRFLRVGTLPYVAGVLREVINNTAHELSIEMDSGPVQQHALMVAIANGPFYGGGMMICPEATRDDGLLDVCIVGQMPRREVLRLLPLVFSGKHVEHPRVTMHRTRALRIESEAPSEVQLDGELVGQLPAEFRVAPRALPVLMARTS
jgi:YegS/Rv2252/BmrU family lipid kinase